MQKPTLEITRKTRDIMLGILHDKQIPPRKVSMLNLFISILNTGSTIFAMIFCIAVSGMGLGLIPHWIARGEILGGGIISLFMAIMGIYGLTAPVRFLIPIYSALQNGTIADAVIESLTIYPPNNQSTFAAIENGHAIGTRRVHCASRTFTEKYQIDEPWISELKIGSELRVLVHPRENKTVLELGIKS